MAIEGVMKIFLMVAVIIVGMSFLMKAFGIDLLGWLMDKFGGLGIPTDAKVLHVKADPDAKEGGEIWEFHLTEGEPASKWDFFGKSSELVHTSEEEWLFFSLKNAPNRCILISTDENGVGDTDGGRIYVIKDGARIQADLCGDIEACISKFVEKKLFTLVDRTKKCTSCETIFSCSQTPKNLLEYDCKFDNKDTTCHNFGYYINCRGPSTVPQSSPPKTNSIVDFEEKVIKKQKFGTAVISDNCLNHPGLCNVLGESKKILEELKDGDTYKVKFGLLCENGKWNVCSPKVIKENAGKGPLNTECKPEDETFKWTEPTIPESTYTEKLDGWFGEKNTILSLGSSKVFGTYSIRGHVDNPLNAGNRPTMNFIPQKVIEVKNDFISFFAKVGVTQKTDILVTLYDDDNHIVSFTVKNIDEDFKGYSYVIPKEMFGNFPAFNWRIEKIQFLDAGNNGKGATNDLFIDDLVIN